jgi:hypothetical protein
MMRGNELLTAAKVPDLSRAPAMNATRSECGLIRPAISSPAPPARRADHLLGETILALSLPGPGLSGGCSGLSELYRQDNDPGTSSSSPATGGNDNGHYHSVMEDSALQVRDGQELRGSGYASKRSNQLSSTWVTIRRPICWSRTRSQSLSPSMRSTVGAALLAAAGARNRKQARARSRFERELARFRGMTYVP